MALSKASCTGRGLIPAIGGHVHRMFDEGEDDLFSLSLDDVMDDRPWTADELMGGGGARPSSPNPALAPKTASAPTPAQPAVSTPAPTPAPTSAPTPAPRPAATRPRRRHFSQQRRRANRPTAPLCTAPSSCLFLRHASLRSQGSMSVARQVAYDSWAAADLDETSTGMPALDVPVNPLFAANTSAADYEGGTAYSDYSDGYAGNGRIETEDYGTASSDYPNDPYAATPAPEYDPEAASAPAYTKSTGEERFADYYAEEKALRFSEFPQLSRLPLSPLSLPCSASLRLRDSSCSAAPPKRSRRPSKKRTITSTWTSTPSRRPQRRRRRVARAEGGRWIPHPAPASKCCFVIQLHFSEVLRCLFRHFSGFYTLSLQMRFTVQALEEGPCAAGGPHVLQIKLLGDDSREPSSWKLFADGACVADGSGAFARECFCEAPRCFWTCAEMPSRLPSCVNGARGNTSC